MSIRIERINELIKQQLNLMIQREFAGDLGVVVITDIETAMDLKTAIVYFRCLEQGQIKSITAKLQKNAHNFQQQMGKIITVRNIPKLTFLFDESQEKIDRVEELLNKINKDK